jgi:amino acid transporter
VCGWANFIGNGAGDASFANGWAAFLSAAVVASGGEAISTQSQVGVSIAILLFWSLLNFFRVDQVGWLNNLAAVFQFASIFLVFIVLLARAPVHSSVHYIFTQYYNETGFTSRSYVVAAGLTTSLFTFAGVCSRFIVN